MIINRHSSESWNLPAFAAVGKKMRFQLSLE
jgi:hypothetical protein